MSIKFISVFRFLPAIVLLSVSAEAGTCTLTFKSGTALPVVYTQDYKTLKGCIDSMWSVAPINHIKTATTRDDRFQYIVKSLEVKMEFEEESALHDLEATATRLFQ